MELSNLFKLNEEFKKLTRKMEVNKDKMNKLEDENIELNKTQNKLSSENYELSHESKQLREKLWNIEIERD